MKYYSLLINLQRDRIKPPGEYGLYLNGPYRHTLEEIGFVAGSKDEIWIEIAVDEDGNVQVSFIEESRKK